MHIIPFTSHTIHRDNTAISYEIERERNRERDALQIKRAQSGSNGLTTITRIYVSRLSSLHEHAYKPHHHALVRDEILHIKRYIHTLYIYIHINTFNAKLYADSAVYKTRRKKNECVPKVWCVSMAGHNELITITIIIYKINACHRVGQAMIQTYRNPVKLK